MREPQDVRESKTVESIIDFLIDIPLFDELRSSELKIIGRQMNFVEINKNETVFKEGDKGDYVCFVVNGILDVIKQSASRRDVVIASLSTGRSIGEMSAIDDYPRSATVKARTNATLVILSRKGFELILQSYPKIGIKVLKGLARVLSMNLRKTSSQLADYVLPLS
jgi:CRP-like cAMP-binding protein